MKNIIIEEKFCDLRLDKFVLDYLGEEHTRSFIQRLIQDGKILVNDKIVKSGYKLKLTDVVDIFDFELKSLDIEKENIPIDIVYEDEDLIVVNKPQGLIVHPAPNINSGTLVNALLYHCKNLSGINGVERPGIVHRIDKDTSGLLVVAKNDLSHKFLSDQFKVHSIRREYVALVHGVMKKSHGRISNNLGRHPKDRIKMAVVPEGRNAITDYTVLRRYNKCSLVLCKLHTGRTHQIRVHMSYLGFPIVGDPVYGLKKDNVYNNGQLLHARVIGFIHPRSKKYMEFKVSLPDYFKNIISNL
mgnify:CR=1 FL=1